MIERSNAEAREISEKAGDIFNTVSTLAERLSKLGNTLNTAGNHYNDTVTALAGKQGLYGKVERFKTLSTKVTKALPDIEHRHIDFEDHKLQLIVEELPSEEHSQDEVLPEGSLLVAPSSDETADSENLDIPQNSEESKA
jgi:DNA recombination protein RmuC